MASLIHATYLLSSNEPFDPEQRTKAIALGQTTDTWTPVETKDAERMDRHKGVPLMVGQLSSDGGTYSAEIMVGFPCANTQGDIASLLVMVFGKVSLDGRVKLIDLGLPEEFLGQLPGPQFGIPGLRQLVNVPSRPLTMSIFKPCLGLTPGELGEMFRQQALGGSDIVKDDEILPDIDSCPTEARLEACLKAARAAFDETGSMTLYAVNLTGSASNIIERAHSLIAEGANCLLLNVLAYGYPLLEALARDPKVSVPIVAHPALSGGFGSAPEHGIAYRVVLGTLMRVGGADAVLFPSSYGNVALPLSETDAIRNALVMPLSSTEATFPGPSAGIHPRLVPQIIRDYGADVIVNAGGGVHGHPQGSRAGARAFRQAIDLVLDGKSVEETEESPELREALKIWG